MPVHNGHVREPEPSHRRAPRAVRIRAWAALAVAGVLVFGGSSAVAAALGGPVVSRGEALAGGRVADGTGTEGAGDAGGGDGDGTPGSASTLPVPGQTSAENGAGPDDGADGATDDAGGTGGADDADDAVTSPRTDLGDGLCADPAVAAALQGGADVDVIAAVGGAEAFRSAVVGGNAPCLSLTEPHRVWVVVNKQRALDPIDYWPEPQARAEGVQRTSGGHLRADVAVAVSQLAAAAAAEGAGAVGVNSGFRSYAIQQSTYAGHVGALGRDAADLISARPGHSEHQTGLAVDLVACDRGCGTLERFAGTPQAEWLAANAWRFGFIVRYENGMTAVTGYDWEPWHLRYLGVDLAKAYHDGGFRTLEEFFGLPAAPGYPG